ncbi:DUF4426 domain-containing protein [Pseudomarimonas arenosa]|uniref:DUF4426 domain-containing protein n=1 Tax=Pseudomarimonas arenosa TaxID=2774145 RepID=A0AAW3ZK85_9GAMM|nr:DUF4426 domain-containing protein [Pseudomarimonas arenosa]MBD8525582.1 DUF4426 domain-containing protein [Pseudomarimonas arenosa]
MPPRLPTTTARRVRLGLALTALLSCVSVSAEKSISAGEYTVHYNALSTLDLSPEVARSYSVSRSANRGLLNIAVRQKSEQGDHAAAAKLSGEAVNEAGQRQALYFREIREADAIYYLSEPPVRPGDTWRFELQVEIENGPTVPLRFSQEFFAPLPGQR